MGSYPGSVICFFTVHPFQPSPMVCHYISDELKEMALSISFQGLPDSEVYELMGISCGPSSDCEAHIATLVRFHTRLSHLVGHATSLQCRGSSSLTALIGSLTWLLQNCKLSFMRFLGSRCQCKPLLVHSNGKVISWQKAVAYVIDTQPTVRIFCDSYSIWCRPTAEILPSLILQLTSAGGGDAALHIEHEIRW